MHKQSKTGQIGNPEEFRRSQFGCRWIVWRLWQCLLLFPSVRRGFKHGGKDAANCSQPQPYPQGNQLCELFESSPLSCRPVQRPSKHMQICSRKAAKKAAVVAGLNKSHPRSIGSVKTVFILGPTFVAGNFQISCLMLG